MAKNCEIRFRVSKEIQEALALKAKAMSLANHNEYVNHLVKKDLEPKVNA